MSDYQIRELRRDARSLIGKIKRRESSILRMQREASGYRMQLAQTRFGIRALGGVVR